MHVDAVTDFTHTHTHPCIKRTRSEVLIYIDATMHIFDASSCSSFDHSNHSQFLEKSNRANKLLQNAQTGYGNHPVAYSKGTTGSFLWGKAGGAWSWPLTLNLAQNVWTIHLLPTHPFMTCTRTSPDYISGSTVMLCKWWGYTKYWVEAE